MAENKPQQQQPDPEVQRLVEGLAKSDVRPDCPACGKHTKWILFERLVQVPQANLVEGHGALAMACGHCGFVRLHLASLLDQYMDPRNH